jgi:hypothetical protein
MLRTFPVLVALVWALLPARAQTPEFEQLPVWPADGKTPKSLAEKYVFRDSATMEIVISYPTDPNDPSGRRTIYRYRPQNQVEAHVSVVIKRLLDDRLEYAYTVANAPTARESIAVWSVVGPDSATTLVAEHPRWTKVHLKNSKLKQAALPIAPAGDPVYFSGDGLAIAPGQEASGFKVTSAYAPGFTTAYAQGGSPLSTNGDLPLAVFNQLRPLMRWEQINQIVLTLGPRYSAVTPKRTIAEEYRAGLNQMLMHGQIMPESGFVLALSAILDACRSDVNRCRPADIDSASMRAQGSAEKEIAMAVLLALGTRANR